MNLQKGISLPIVIIIVAVLVIGGGALYFGLTSIRDSDNSENMPVQDNQSAGMESTSAGTAGYAGKVIAGTSAPLLDFIKSDYDKALASDKLIVLYFYANWCPICKAETKDALYPAFNELTGDKVIGFQVNYNDNQTDNDEKNLAREFGVAYQHTKVFVKNNQRVLKSPESWNKDRYFSEINSSLSK